MINANKFVSATRRQAERMREIRHGAVKALGNHARDRIRSRIPPGANEPAGIAFPGYAATGHLRQHFQVFGVAKGYDQSRVTVGLVRNAGRLARIKAYVHEYGKRIHARRAPFLVFRIGNTWIRTKSVYIRPKKYFETGWRAASQGAGAILQRYINANWGK